MTPPAPDPCAAAVTAAARDVARASERVRDVDFLSKGEISFYQRSQDFKMRHGGCVAAVQQALQQLQPSILKGVRVGDVEGSVAAVRRFVTASTDRIDIALDEHWASAHKARVAPSTAERSAPAEVKHHEPAARSATARPRPQDAFDPRPDNSNAPFVPDLSHFEGLLSDPVLRAPPSGTPPPQGKLERHAAQLAGDTAPSAAAVARYSHPFAGLLERLPGMYPPWQLEPLTPRPPEALDAQPLTLVTTPADLQELAAHLDSVREVAVDLEHSDRSFQGFTCLMQVSTRARDFIVDVLALRSRVGAALGRVFADPRTLKVLHGADHDVLWLQKDFGVYVVNMFDTGQAARLLHMQCGLGHLLDAVCQVKTDKRYQRADWRQRPLPEDMLTYARMDTHYLLYMADCLRQRLLDKGLLEACFERSRAITLQLYEKALFSDGDYLAAYHRLATPLSPQQLAAFAALYAWRDRAARALDENAHHVMPRHLMLALAQAKPTTVPAVMRLVGRRSRAACDSASEIVDAIKEAMEHVAEDARPLTPKPAAAQGGVAHTRFPSSSPSPSSEGPSPSPTLAAEAPRSDADGTASAALRSKGGAPQPEAEVAAAASEPQETAAPEQQGGGAARARQDDDASPIEEVSLLSLGSRRKRVRVRAAAPASAAATAGTGAKGTHAAAAAVHGSSPIAAGERQEALRAIEASFACPFVGVASAQVDTVTGADAAGPAAAQPAANGASAADNAAAVRAAADALAAQAAPDTQAVEAAVVAPPDGLLSVREQQARARTGKRPRLEDATGLLGDVTTIALQHSKREGGRGRGRGRPLHDAAPFDYEAAAARAHAPGRGRSGGRGGRGRGRDDRGRGRGRGSNRKLGPWEGRANSGGFNPFAVEDSAFKGAARSKQARGGNKSGTM